MIEVKPQSLWGNLLNWLLRNVISERIRYLEKKIYADISINSFKLQTHSVYKFQKYLFNILISL